MGSRFFYLGDTGGLKGWLMFKDGQVQIMYSTPDNKSALVGAMFGEHGENLTAQQVTALLHDNKEASDLIVQAQKQAANEAGISLMPNGPSTASTSPDTTKKIPASSQLQGGVPPALTPGDRLINDLSAASTIVVGRITAPEILMVMDPHCPHCQMAWQRLRDSVINGKIHIRMIPIGTLNTDNERAAAVFLGVEDPLATWDSYVAGDKAQLVGTPSATALASVRANHALIDKWSIQNTPYIVYRAKDGKVKILQGEPDKVAVILGDMGL
jgi:hypothetical protein